MFLKFSLLFTSCILLLSFVSQKYPELFFVTEKFCYTYKFEFKLIAPGDPEAVWPWRSKLTIDSNGNWWTPANFFKKWLSYLNTVLSYLFLLNQW